MIEYSYVDVDLRKIIHTGIFNFEHATTLAGWIHKIEDQITEEERKEAHRRHNYKEDEHQCEGHEHQHGEHEYQHEGYSHHHHHHHEEGEAEEYGINTFIYYHCPTFDIHKLDHFIATEWSRHIICTRGVCYFSHDRDMSYPFERVGTREQPTEAGLWYTAAFEEGLTELMCQEPGLLRDWDEKYGGRMQEIVFISQHTDKEQIICDLDGRLEE